jgi:DNA-3-methyladenine glycosylase II
MDRKILDHFKKEDPVLYGAYLNLANRELMTIHLPTDHFSALCREIIGQQLSSKVARVIFERFKNIFPDKRISPKSILKFENQTLRATGMSNAKVNSLKDLSQKIENGEITLKEIEQKDNETIMNELTKVKGIGPWTAEMFLIFALNRSDVFSFGDLGLKNAIKKIYDLQDITNLEIEKIISKWSPYKSYACRILWKSLD